MTIFFTSDTHFGHANIIKYCNRPFKDVNDMTEQLIANWNAVVGPNDTVWHLGDFAFEGKHMSKRQILDVLGRLNGGKRLVFGNHDKRLRAWYNDCGLISCHQGDIHFKFRDSDLHYRLSHRPTPKEFPVDYINLHGHTHYVGNISEADSYDVGVDANGYAPVSLEEIERRLKLIARDK